ncbi:UNVERIFIED_CONTAM: hypothetical protein GTU68_015518 [Idotea baltica]|nr:hypothetical protein [Idotea baltica]
MAKSATINKVSLNVADMLRHHYQQHELVLAVHPSETDLRFMVRVLAFALNAHDDLTFTKGLATDDEPEAWQKSLSDEIELWIDFGQVDEKRIRKACGRSKQVVIYTYQARKAGVWWEKNEQILARHDNLSVFHIEAEGIEALAGRNMHIQCNIDEGVVSLGNDELHIDVAVTQYGV